MKAIILDYSDKTILRIDIPKDWEESPEEFVTALPCYEEGKCHFIITDEKNIEVFDIVQCGESPDGYPEYDYKHVMDL